MFHQKFKRKKSSESVDQQSSTTAIEAKKEETDSNLVQKMQAKKEFSLNSVGELLEKNLKWSQIIYEQNRRINVKLLWLAIANWLRVLILAGLVISTIWYAPVIWRMANKVAGQFGINLDQSTNNQISPANLESMLKLFPVDSAKQEQIKAILK